LNDEPLKAALNTFLEAVPHGPLSIEALPLLQASGRTLAKDLFAVIDDPPYSRSIMEGYVLCVADAAAASEPQPVRLEVTGRIPVGQGEAKGLRGGAALEVTTGSFIPPGDFAVLRAWEVHREGMYITIKKPLKTGENIELQGELRRKGDRLLEKGALIGADETFLLASQGILEVPLSRPPRLALFSSGNEVIPAGAPFKPGSIWDCNRYGLSSLIEAAGGVPLFQGIIADDFDLFVRKLKAALEDADMALISGGTGAEGRDFTAELLDAAGPPGALVKGIPMRSGKPLILGASGSKPILCVAGHPPEAARGFQLFAKPMIAQLLGRAAQKEGAN